MKGCLLKNISMTEKSWVTMLNKKNDSWVYSTAAAAKSLQSCPTLCDPIDGSPLQYPCLENPMDGGAWEAAVRGVAKSRTWLSNFTFIFHLHALEKEMATHSSIIAWRIPGTGEPGGLPSMGSHRVGHDWSNLAAAAASGKVGRREKFRVWN